MVQMKHPGIGPGGAFHVSPLPSFQDPGPAHHGSKHFHFGNRAQNGEGVCPVSQSLKQRILTCMRNCCKNRISNQVQRVLSNSRRLPSK